MAVSGASSLRMSGMNSGFDTESIVNALTAATKLKMTKAERGVLKLQAQQEAYRSIITKFSDFKNKYFDILNRETYLKSTTTFNQYSASISINGETASLAGVKVVATSNATPANYNVKLTSKATQATMSAKNLSSNASFDPSAYSDDTQQYAMKVTVGTTTKQIVFDGGAAPGDVVDNINAKLKEAFGENNAGNGIVSVVNDGGDYSISSQDKKAVAVSAVQELDGTVVLGGADFGTGSNSLTVMIDGEEKTVSFSTVDEDYFKGLFLTDESKAQIESIVGKSWGSMTAAEQAVYVDSKTGFLKGKLALDSDIDALGAAAGDKAVAAFKATLNYDEDTDIWTDDDGVEYTDYDFNQMYDEAYDEAADAEREKIGSNGFYIDDKAKTIANELKAKQGLYLEAVNGQYTELQHDAYEAWKTALGGDYVKTRDYDKMSDEQKALFDDEYDRRSALQKQTAFDKAIDSAFDAWCEADMAVWNAKPENAGNQRDLLDYSLDTWKTGGYTTAGGYIAGGDVDITDPANIDTVFNSANPYFGEAYDSYNSKKLDRDKFLAGAYDEFVAYGHNIYAKAPGNLTAEEYVQSKSDPDAVAEITGFFNESAVKNTLGNLTFDDGTKLEVNVTRDGGGVLTGFEVKAYTLADDKVTKNYKNLAITAGENSKSDFGGGVGETTEMPEPVSVSAKLNSLGLTADASGNYNVKINGVQFSFKGESTIRDMMSAINSSKAGVTMSFSTLENTFLIKSKDYGKSGTIELDDDNQGLMGALGFNDSTVVTPGTNMTLTINGHDLEVDSNVYEIDGTTFTFSDNAKLGQEFDVEVARDNTKVKETIQQFINDYNDIIKTVYDLVDQKPAEGDYYFLAKADKEDLQLTETQEKDWDTASKLGILYNDSTLTTVMSWFRSAVYESYATADGQNFGLYSMGISTSNDYMEHGKLVISDQDAFDAAFETNADDIMRLFTDPENGLMSKFSTLLDDTIKSTGARADYGILVAKAGTASGTSALQNSIFDEIRRLNSNIATLEERYNNQQDRYWGIYSAMEAQLGTLNSQTSYIQQMMGGN
jgi:flagellar capping protein FliD